MAMTEAEKMEKARIRQAYMDDLQAKAKALGIAPGAAPGTILNAYAAAAQAQGLDPNGAYNPQAIAPQQQNGVDPTRNVQPVQQQYMPTPQKPGDLPNKQVVRSGGQPQGQPTDLAQYALNDIMGNIGWGSGNNINGNIPEGQTPQQYLVGQATDDLGFGGSNIFSGAGDIWDAVSGQAAKDAAKKVVGAIGKAGEISKEAAEQARNDIWNDYGEAFKMYAGLMGESQTALGQGAQDVRNTLWNTGTMLSGMMDKGEAAAQQALQTGSNDALATYGRAYQVGEDALKGGGANAVDTYGRAYDVGANALRDSAQGSIGDYQNAFQYGEGAVQQAGSDAYNTVRGYGADAIGAANAGMGQARGDIVGGLQATRDTLNNNYGAANATLQSGLADVARLTDPTRALNRIDQGVAGAVGELDTYSNLGDQAAMREAAMSGALGQAAQQRAFSEFTESPGQKFLRERQEQSLLRNSAATGGLGGGNVRTALQEQAYGIAAQQQQQQIENLRSIAGVGANASNAQGNYKMAGGTAGADVITQNQMAALNANVGYRNAIAGNQTNLGQTMAGYENNAGNSLSNLSAQMGMNESQLRAMLGLELGNISQQTGNTLAGLSANTAQNIAGVRQGYGSTLAGLAAQAGQGVAGAQQATGNAIAGLSSQAGQDVAGLQQSTGLNLGSLLSQYMQNRAGIGLDLGKTAAGAYDTYSTNLSNLLSGSANNLANLAVGRGTALGNINLQSGNTLANLAVQAGNAQAAGIQGQANAINNLMGQGLGILGAKWVL
jgi:hypothetical protein